MTKVKKQRLPKAVKEARERYYFAIRAASIAQWPGDRGMVAEEAKAAEIHLLETIEKALGNAYKRGKREVSKRWNEVTAQRDYY